MPLEDMANAALEMLANAPGARSDPEGTARAVEAALAAAPHDLDVRLGAYRFYFYTHRFAEAVPQAETILRIAAQRLNVAADWREVGPDDAEFTAAKTAPGLYLQALIALAYCYMRLGDFERGQPYLDKAFELDPTDRFAAIRLVRAAAAADEDD
ncbi:tetratricopeptide (TPR) repeat protein [Rhodovulum iodosum]|uniref:Tetratricopeptide (TPR) repeat protein n=1 Tax=Rhodovulum iodosum TaxID=68291 RepID=A0ABV3XVQ1_9RHOB|nr:tetratricopeptide repeat protein [Rhodovulum robiginosum]